MEQPALDGRGPERDRGPHSDRRRYKGILKHKNWRPGGANGTICPAWTHDADGAGFAGDTEAHPWPVTVAQALLDASLEGDDGKTYAARGGIAFQAYDSNDGSWHGFPVPWVDVPLDVQDGLVAAGQVRRRDIRRQAIDTRDIRWALRSDGT